MKPDAGNARARGPKRRGPSGNGDAPVEWERFLDALREVPYVRRACDHVGVSPSTAYQRRKDHKDFADAWDAAIAEGYDALEASVYVRAMYGWRPGVCPACAGTGENGPDECRDCHGSGRDEVTERPSDDLAKWLLRYRRAEVFGKTETVNLTARPVIRLRIVGGGDDPGEPQSGG